MEVILYFTILDSTVAASLMLLSHLLPPKTAEKSGKTVRYKPSIASSKNSIIQIAKVSVSVKYILIVKTKLQRI